MRRSISLFPLLILCACTALAQNAKELHRKAESLIKENRFAEAIPIYNQLIAASSSDAIALRGRGFAYISLGDMQNGKRDYQSALAIDPECANCYAQLASIEAAQNNVQMAVKLISSAIDLDKKLAPAYYLRGKLRSAMGNRAGALADFDHAVEYAPKNPDYRAERGLAILADGDRKRALEEIDAAIRLDPANATSYFHRTHFYVATEQWEEALKDINRSLQLGMKTADAYLTRGAIYAHLGRKAESLADGDSAIALDSTNIGAYYNRAMSRYQMEDMDGSCQDTRRALELTLGKDPDSPDIEQYNAAIRDHCDPTLMSFYYQRGIAAYNRNDYPQAISYYNSGLQKFPESPALIMFRGNAQLAMGNYRQALDDYAIAMENLDRCVRELADNYRQQVREQDNAQLRAGLLASLQETIFEAKLGLGDKEGAMSAINMAVDAAADVGGAIRGTMIGERGALLLMEGRNEDALKEFKSALAMNSPWVTTLLERGRVNGPMCSPCLCWLNERDVVRIWIVWARFRQATA
jgi:tetratricopeptide (TPR) repeat protein